MPTQIGSRQLRSSSAHCARKLAKSEELARRKWTWKWRQRWWKEEDEERGGGGGGEGGGAGTAVIESNNPHLGGGALLDACLTSVL